MRFLKGVGGLFSGILIFLIICGLPILFIFGVAWAAVHLIGYAVTLSILTLLASIILLLPLAAFRRSRVIAMYGFLIASFIFGASTWLAGFLATAGTMGTVGVMVGLFFALVGVVPLGIIGSMYYGDWTTVSFLLVGLALTFGARSFTFWLAHLMDKAEYGGAYS